MVSVIELRVERRCFLQISNKELSPKKNQIVPQSVSHIRPLCARVFEVFLKVSQSLRYLRTTPFLATNHPANTPDSPESPRFILRESPPDQPVAVEEAPVFEGAAG